MTNEDRIHLICRMLIELLNNIAMPNQLRINIKNELVAMRDDIERGKQ